MIGEFLCIDTATKLHPSGRRGMTVDERREFDRHPTSFYSEVRYADTGELVGSLTEISAGGMMLVGDKPLEVGRKLRLQIELPREVGPGPHLEVTAQVCWSDRDPNLYLYASGLEFSHDKTNTDVAAYLGRILKGTH